MKTWNCLITGVGGQGTILASKILAQTAVSLNRGVRTSETIGMAQRGGCVVSHVRIGQGSFSPIIPKGSAHLILGFEPAEAVRHLSFLKEGGLCVVSSREIRPTTDRFGTYKSSEMLEYLKSKANTLVLDTDELCRRVGSPKVVNTLLLGAAAYGGALPFSIEELEKTVEQMLPPRVWDINKVALRLYSEMAR